MASRTRRHTHLVRMVALALAYAFVAAEPGAAQVVRRADSVSAGQRQSADSAARDSLARLGAPVVVHGDTVLHVPTRFGSFSAQERADAIVGRVNGLMRVRLDSLTLVPGETATDIVAGDLVLMTVSDADAVALGRPRADVADEFGRRLWHAMGRVSIQSIVRTVAFGALWTLLATLVLAVLLVALRRGFTRLEAWIEARRSVLPSLRIKTLDLLSSGALANLLVGAARFLRNALIVLLFYFYLPLVLSFFPWTERYSDQLLGYVARPVVSVVQAIVAYLPNVLFIAVILFVTRNGLRLIRYFFVAIERGTLEFDGFDREWAPPTYKIVRFLVIAFSVVVLFPYLPGADSEAFKGVTIFLGVLFSLGSSSAIANVVAGVVLTYTRAFSVGDRVRIGETTGDVVAKTLLVTRIRTIKNVDTTIPNAMVLGAHVLNYSAMARTNGLILNTTVTIGYDVPWRQVYDLLVAAAHATPSVLEKPAPFVLQTSLGDFSVAYEINAYTDDAAVMARTYSLLHANIQDQFNAAGVEILSPRYEALRDGNTTTVPPGERPPGYAAPGFRVEPRPPAP